jgi:AraC-like DNA-binding protein
MPPPTDITQFIFGQPLRPIPAYFAQIDSQPMAVGHEPLFRPLGIAAEALHCKPEFCRVIRDSQMNRLVRHQVSKNGVWCHNQAPVERQVSLRGAVSPLCSLSHNIAAHLARTAPDILVHPEVARALEQGLVNAMVSCISGGEAAETGSVRHRHAVIMRRLEEVLEANPDRTLYVAELCGAAGASGRTLRACCQEHLGMSPTRYLWLRRMHLARRALRMADPAAASVTEIATSYGFWELGRFSVAYRSLFGESPSASLRRHRAVAKRRTAVSDPLSSAVPLPAMRRGALILGCWRETGGVDVAA